MTQPPVSFPYGTVKYCCAIQRPPLGSLSDVSSARSGRSMHHDATLISAQRADASTNEARAAECDRHLTDLEEYRSGKNKHDLAKDGADMTEPHVKNLESSKLLRQRVPAAKELRMGGELSECVDCDGAMDSSSGSTPFLKGGEIARNSANQASHRAHFAPPQKLQKTVLQLSSLVRPDTTRRLACNRSSRKQTSIVNTQS